MKKAKLLLIMLTGSMFAFQSCKDDNKEDEMVMAKQEFVTEAASSNMLEVQAGAMAQQKADNEAVEHYGEHMVTDHTKATVELAAIVNNKDLNMPTQLMEKHQQMLNSIANLTGAAFDKAFMNMMVTSHEQTVALFEKASIQVNDNELRAFAKAKLPTLKAHLEEAKELNATVNP
ncbi:DUF4142 domain-containing protein [Mucilaginibacter limnophilus]|uniref:DUF4142 domain-containing protein n=1 Tax=Mucilaginibacter limnophilus TaxID=1932778 RepID=A0A3S2ULU1_9SPHI|nr:DUF4142 domain-containing protein [Mucilaginibacter limnophilus]RVT97273.1 DUF4142 domain-containing protein [Mucilaginibacter limnophilus]